MSRSQNMVRNMKWSYIGTFSTIIMGFVVRTVFVHSLGKTFLGLNSLYLSIIGVLSIAELGIGSLLNTQLYKPVAEGDKGTIIAILQLYKKIYRIIAVIILVIGLAIFPFIDILIKGADRIDNYKVYYFFFLFNTVITYFVAYKFSISNAEQKDYISINFETVSTIVMYLLQLFSLTILHSYFWYLFVNSATVLIKSIIITLYMNKKYPILNIKKTYTLEDNKKLELKKNILGGITNKFSDVAINQTDSMIISAFVNVDMLGITSNYVTIRGYIERFTKPLLDNHGSIIGNYVAVESKHRKKFLVKTLQIYSLYIYGLSSLLLYYVSTPLVTIWLGNDFIASNSIVLTISLGLLISGVGDRPYVIFKCSHGIFYDDWYVSFAAAIINLLVSIILVRPFGVTGVFIGTIFANLTSVIWRPLIFYKKGTDDRVSNYFMRLIRNIALVIITGAICYFLFSYITINSIILEIVFKSAIVTILFSTIYVLFFYRSEEFKYIICLLKGVVKKRNAQQKTEGC